MTRDEYSPYKAVHHQDKLKQIKKGEQIIPVQVQMVLTNRCQHSCIFCAYHSTGFVTNEEFNPKDELEYSKVLEFLDDFKNMGIKAIHYTGGGEPLLHPKAEEIFWKTIDKGFELALVTNGELLTESICKDLGRASWVRVSVDAVTEDTFSNIRKVKGDKFQKVCRNVAQLVKYKKDSVIGVGFVVNKLNYKEIYKAAKLFKEIGVDNFRISASFTPEGIDHFKDIQPLAIKISKEAEELSQNGFKVFNLFNDRLKDLFIGTQNYSYCPYKEFNTYIGADCNLYTCCTLAYNKRGRIGNLKDKSFEEFWKSSGKEFFFSQHNPKIDCALSCMYKERNKFINYCLKEKPKHVNYV